MMLYGIPRLWQLFTLASLDKQKELILALKKTTKDGRIEINHKEVLLEKLVANQPRYETHQNLFERAKVIRQFMREYI